MTAYEAHVAYHENQVRKLTAEAAQLEALVADLRAQLADSDRRLLKVHEALDEEYDPPGPDESPADSQLSVTPYAPPPDAE